MDTGVYVVVVVEKRDSRGRAGVRGGCGREGRKQREKEKKKNTTVAKPAGEGVV
jgi:hypothetical protein